MANRPMSPWFYLLVWGALVVLTAVSWGVSRLSLGAYAIAVAVSIAGVKATLVVSFFMHLFEQGAANRIVVVSLLGFVTLLVGLCTLDVSSRAELPHALSELLSSSSR